MRLWTIAATTALFAMPMHAVMAAEVSETVMTTAAPDKVWGMVGKFDAISTWLPGAASSPADKGDVLGSVRIITLKAPGSPTVTEKLTAHAAASYSYSIMQVDPKVLPVTDYTSTISVAPASGGSAVTWTGNFQPAGGADDATAKKAVSGLYQAGLNNIKTLAER